MVNVLSDVLAGLVVVSLLTIVAYAIVFLAVEAWTVLAAFRRDPRADGWDEGLADLLRSQLPGQRR